MRELKVFLGIILIFLLACEESDEGSELLIPSFGYSYSPLSIGAENIYEIDTVIFDDFTGRVDTLRFQQKEAVVSSFLDQTGRTAYLIEISTRLNDSTDWRLIKQLTKTRTPKRLEILENNTITVPLVFPISEGKKWNSNSLNALDEKEYEFESIDVPFSLSALNYDSVLTVAQEDVENLIERKFSEEKYAANIGLLFRKDIQLRTELNGDTTSGYIATMRLLRKN